MTSQQKQEVKYTLIYQGEIRAIKLYLSYTHSRVEEAKQAVMKIAESIQPKQAA